jgi:hypothetical protein
MKYVSIVCFLFWASNIIAQQANQKPYAVKYYPIAEVKDLEVHTSGGSITVENTGDTQARVEVYITTSQGGQNSSEIAERLENYTLKYVHINNKLVCEAKANTKTQNWRNGLNISYKIYTAQNLNTKLHTSGGSIGLSQLSGNLQFSTSGGSLILKNLDGDIKGSTSGGSITLSDCHEVISLSTSGGAITAKNSTGHLNLSTSGGGISLSNLKGNITASTSGGSINAKAVNGKLNLSTSGGSLDLNEISGNLTGHTSGGSINAQIIALDNQLELGTSGGSININMPLNTGMHLNIAANRISAPSLQNFEGQQSKSKIYGTVNGGGAKVRLSASSHININ